MPELETAQDQSADQPIRFQLRIVGPIKRSTLGISHPDPEWQAVGDVLYWSWCCRLQANRLASSLIAELPRGRQLHVFGRKLSATASYDEHCLIMAAGNLDRALERAPRYLRGELVPKDTRRALRLLRNVYEHWDTLRVAYREGGVKNSAAQKLAEEFPDAEPWSLKLCENGDIILAEVVSVRNLVRDLRKLEAAGLWNQRRLYAKDRHKVGEAPNTVAQADG